MLPVVERTSHSFRGDFRVIRDQHLSKAENFMSMVHGECKRHLKNSYVDLSLQIQLNKEWAHLWRHMTSSHCSVKNHLGRMSITQHLRIRLRKCEESWIAHCPNILAMVLVLHIGKCAVRSSKCIFYPRQGNQIVGWKCICDACNALVLSWVTMLLVLQRVDNFVQVSVVHVLMSLYMLICSTAGENRTHTIFTQRKTELKRNGISPSFFDASKRELNPVDPYYQITSTRGHNEMYLEMHIEWHLRRRHTSCDSL